MTILNFCKTQADMQQRAAELGHGFQWCEDLPLGPGKKYNSEKDVSSFLVYYNALPLTKRHCYEIIRPLFYLYFDLDLTINVTTLTDTDLFYWFDSIYREFIDYLIAGYSNDNIKYVGQSKEASGDARFTKATLSALLAPKWVVTSASGKKDEHTWKLSLHLVNHNVIFDNMTHLKKFYKHFESFIDSFVPEDHPFVKAFDKSVASNNRGMRLCGSTKRDSDRVLKMRTDLTSLGMKMIDSFITNAPNDPTRDRKMFNDRVASALFDERCDDGTGKETTLPATAFLTSHIKELDLNEIRKLLDMLSLKRWDSYDSWLNLAFIFKRQNLPYELFEEYSKKSSRFDSGKCYEGWMNIELKEVERPLTLGTLHFYAREDNIVQYNTFKIAHTKPRVRIPFTPNETITERFIPSDLYIRYFEHFNIIALKSNMMTGKTRGLPSVFDDSRSIVVPYFRITLGQEFGTQWKDRGFEFYQDIKGKIDLKKHPRIVIQIDSLHRLIGKCDLLILDEIESTLAHLCGSEWINKVECYNALRCYVKNTPKVILADANLSDETVKVITEMRINETVKIVNTAPSFSHLQSTFLNEKQELLELIVEQVSRGKRVCVPTNSLRFSKQVNNLIQTTFPEKKILLLNSESEKDFSQTSVANWVQYDVLIYTPTIVAGVSFDLSHFHVCCAFFINRSCNAEMCSQMLFRVRHLIDNQMYICTPLDIKESPAHPITLPEIEKHVNRLIQTGHQHAQISGLSINHYEERVVKNQYYKVFCTYLRKKNLSSQYFESYLRHILQTHGVQIQKHFFTAPSLTALTDLEKAKVEQDFTKTMAKITLEEVNELIQVEPIDHYEYEELRTNRKEKTKEEDLQMSKFQLLSAFNIEHDQSLVDCNDWIMTNKKYVSSYNSVKSLLGKDLSSCIEEVQQRHNKKYDKQLIERATLYKANQYSSDSEEDGYTRQSDVHPLDTLPSPLHDKQSLKIIRKEDVKSTVIHAIHYDKKWLKIKVCLEFLRAMGFKTLTQATDDLAYNKSTHLSIKPEWNALHAYCRENEETIRSLFSCKKMVWSTELSDKEKKTLSQFVNDKLDKTIGVNYETNGKYIWYSIVFLFEPNLPINVLTNKEAEQEKTRIYSQMKTDEEEDELLIEETDIQTLQDIKAIRQHQRKKRKEQLEKQDEEELKKIIKAREEKKQKKLAELEPVLKPKIKKRKGVVE